MRITQRVLRNWSISDSYSLKPIRSYWGKSSMVTTDENSRYVLKEKENSARSVQECNLLLCLQRQALPVAVPLLTDSGRPYAENNGRVFCLYPYLPGTATVDHYSEGSLTRARHFGLAIGRLHKALFNCSSVEGFPEMNLVDQVVNWAVPIIQKNSSTVGLERIDTWTERFRQFGANTYPLLPKQLIHRDINPSNMLFEDGKLSGIVDYDMVTQGPRIFDVCYCATSILVGGFSDIKRREQWSEIFRSLPHGYEELNRLTKEERASVFAVLIAIQLIFMAFSFETGSVSAAKHNTEVLKWLCANPNSNLCADIKMNQETIV